jgi:hypothetical protein
MASLPRMIRDLLGPLSPCLESIPRWSIERLLTAHTSGSAGHWNTQMANTPDHPRTPLLPRGWIIIIIIINNNNNTSSSSSSSCPHRPHVGQRAGQVGPGAAGLHILLQRPHQGIQVRQDHDDHHNTSSSSPSSSSSSSSCPHRPHVGQRAGQVGPGATGLHVLLQRPHQGIQVRQTPRHHHHHHHHHHHVLTAHTSGSARGRSGQVPQGFTSFSSARTRVYRCARPRGKAH